MDLLTDTKICSMYGTIGGIIYSLVKLSRFIINKIGLRKYSSSALPLDFSITLLIVILGSVGISTILEFYETFFRKKFLP